jgi:hypothetical protein
VAFSLADDDASLGRLRQRYGGFVDGARNPDGLRVALAGADPGSLSSTDFSKVTADNEAFNGWVAKMKDRFRAASRATIYFRLAITSMTYGASRGSRRRSRRVASRVESSRPTPPTRSPHAGAPAFGPAQTVNLRA